MNSLVCTKWFYSPVLGSRVNVRSGLRWDSLRPLQQVPLVQFLLLWPDSCHITLLHNKIISISLLIILISSLQDISCGYDINFASLLPISLLMLTVWFCVSIIFVCLLWFHILCKRRRLIGRTIRSLAFWVQLHRCSSILLFILK